MKKKTNRINDVIWAGIASWDYKKGNRNKKVLDSFVKYCKKHPELRFWQALSGWTNKSVVIAVDPFYFEGKDK